MLHFSSLDQVLKADAAEKPVDLITEVAPQVVGETNFTLLTIAATATTGGVDRFVHTGGPSR